MWLNVAAAMGVEDLSVGCEWIRAEALSSGGASNPGDAPKPGDAPNSGDAPAPGESD
jgi:hypothetical protein